MSFMEHAQYTIVDIGEEIPRAHNKARAPVGLIVDTTVENVGHFADFIFAAIIALPRDYRAIIDSLCDYRLILRLSRGYRLILRLSPPPCAIIASLCDYRAIVASICDYRSI